MIRLKASWIKGVKYNAGSIVDDIYERDLIAAGVPYEKEPPKIAPPVKKPSVEELSTKPETQNLEGLKHG